VFGISGLWHGANWTFVCWGLYHGSLVVLYRLFVKRGHESGHHQQQDISRTLAPSHSRILERIKDICNVTLTFLLAVIGWVIFRAENISQAWDFVSRMILTAFDDFHFRLGSANTFIAILLLFIVEYLQRDKAHVLQFPDNRLFRCSTVRYSLYASIVLLLFFYAGEVQTFIYFQF
jgi:D-alanyl-lipoteichoic acid acyltransferase DltB (MBOAT superfamily)